MGFLQEGDKGGAGPSAVINNDTIVVAAGPVVTLTHGRRAFWIHLGS